jgi:uncharacterized protein YcgI (DUF1989 family)
VAVPAGGAVRIVNTHGSQVVDTWALALPDLAEWLSMEHTRVALGRLRPRAGDLLYSSHRRPMLSFVDDTSPGVHDTLIAACDRARYRELGADGYHDNCRDNFVRALAELGHSRSSVPCPLNLFMNVRWTEAGSLHFEPPSSRPGDHVTLRAEMDLVVVVSACPQDMLPVNGELQQPSDVALELLRPSPGGERRLP